MNLLDKGATISGCGRYRYLLWRNLGQGEGTCLFVMLNPSTADGQEDDPTIRRCIRFASDWGYSRLEVVNLFALRATNPNELLEPDVALCSPPWQTEFDDAVALASIVVCAWGGHRAAEDIGRLTIEVMLARGITPYCLGVTKTGRPKHPLYLKATTKPERYLI